jgi:hypothetical protein
MRASINEIEVYVQEGEHEKTDWTFYGKLNDDDEYEKYFESLDNETYLLNISMSLKDEDGNDIDPELITSGKLVVALTINGEKTQDFEFECTQHTGFPYEFPLTFPIEE